MIPPNIKAHPGYLGMFTRDRAEGALAVGVVDLKIKALEPP